MNKSNSVSSIIAVGLIFASTIVGLYAINGLEKEESIVDSSEHVYLDTIFSENEYVKKFTEVDNELLAFFANLREDIGTSLFVL